MTKGHEDVIPDWEFFHFLGSNLFLAFWGFVLIRWVDFRLNIFLAKNTYFSRLVQAIFWLPKHLKETQEKEEREKAEEEQKKRAEEKQKQAEENKKLSEESKKLSEGSSSGQEDQSSSSCDGKEKTENVEEGPSKVGVVINDNEKKDQ